MLSWQLVAIGIMGKVQALALELLNLDLSSALTCCVSQDSLLFLSGLQFPYLENGYGHELVGNRGGMKIVF